MRLRGLIEKEIQSDRLGMQARDLVDEIAEELAINRRAVLKIAHRIFVGRRDENVGVLWLRRSERGYDPVLDVKLRAMQGAYFQNGEGAKQRCEHRSGRRNGYRAERAIARIFRDPAKNLCDHFRLWAGVSFRASASACASQPLSAIQAMRIESLISAAGTAVTLIADSLPLSAMK